MSALILNRREAFAGALAALWAVPAVAQAQTAPAIPAWTPRALTLDEARTLTAACERIMPATDTPGATAAGVPQYVDRLLATWCEADETQRVRSGLLHLDAQARGAFGAPFAALPAGRQDELLRRAEAEATAAANAQPPRPHWFLALRDFATMGYFTSEAGATKALRYDPVPGEYRGCVPLKEIGAGWAT
ncbi:gluconate 2-dehydrogenase subunit 3 family protein [Phenylobacterium sp.]|uniref:gluconate 2-dehydrogenase subunit 3 family protein n=1 Tax=Phenylobacterium sp. TaxID=1871053 RepID=UPI0028111E45|nr:gluconate 2-dehydrogenase subunit 3 family protein [Phenylobacterium sp.]